MARWYYEVAGRETGPVPETKIVWLLGKGSLSISDRIRLESEQAWRSLNDVPEFADAVSQAAVASAPAVAGDSAEWSHDDLDSMLGEEAPIVTRRGETQSLRSASAIDRALSDSAEADVSDLDSMLSGVDEAPAATSSRKQAAASQLPADDQWYYKSFGQELGPIGFADLSQMAEDGVLHSDDYVRKGATGAWQRAGRMPQLKFANLDGDKDRLKDSVASFTLSSQRFGEKGLEALKKKAAEETEEETNDEAEAEAEAPEPVKPKKPPKRRKRRLGESADDFAAALLEEEAALSPPTPRPSYRDYQPSGQSPLAAASADPAVAPAMPTPRPVFTPPPAAPAFQRGPSKSSGGGAKFNFDPKMAGIAGGVLVLALAGYFIPWKSFLGGPGKADYEVVAAMFGRVRVMHEKKAGQSEWDAAKKELDPEIKKSLASLRPLTRTNIVAKKLYTFQADGLKPILAAGADAKDELFEEATSMLAGVKKAVDKK